MNNLQKIKLIVGRRIQLVFVLLILFISACEQSDHTIITQDAIDSTITVNKAQESANSKHTTHMILGTGSVQGVYFPIGGVICRLLNRHKSLHGVRCSLESTGGSIYNLRELRKGDFDLVVSQSDWQYHALNGTSTFKNDGAFEDLRSVFALEADPVALIVKSDSDIDEFDHLQNHIVSLGYSRSLQHRIINDLLEAKNWTNEHFKEIVSINDSKQVGYLCDDKVDAILLLMSSLNDYLSDLGDKCKLRFVPIEGDEVKQTINNNPYYRTGMIPRGLYLDSPEDIPSFGLGATFVTTKSTPPKAIYHVVKEIVENFKDFQSLHPSLINLDKAELPTAGITAPLHPGAIRYYKEARLLK